MNMFDEAAALMGTRKMCSLSQTEMAKKLGVSQSYVANKLRLLRFDEGTRERIIKAGLTERHARALLRLMGQSELEEALGRIISEGLNVQRSESLIDLLHNGAAPERIERAEAFQRIETFKDTLERSVESLISMGISAKKFESYYGKKTYITVSIEEI